MGQTAALRQKIQPGLSAGLPLSSGVDNDGVFQESLHTRPSSLERGPNQSTSLPDLDRQGVETRVINIINLGLLIILQHQRPFRSRL